MRRSKKISKLRVTGLCVGNSPVTGEFPPQRTSNAENVSIWWRHHANWKKVLPEELTVAVDPVDGLRCCVNPLWPGDSIRRQTLWSALFTFTVCRLCRDKPLPEPMLTYCKLDPPGANFDEIWFKIQDVLKWRPQFSGHFIRLRCIGTSLLMFCGFSWDWSVIHYIRCRMDLDMKMIQKCCPLKTNHNQDQISHGIQRYQGVISLLKCCLTYQGNHHNWKDCLYI